MFLIDTTSSGIKVYTSKDPSRYFLCQYTQNGRNHQRIYQYEPHGPYVAVGTKEAMHAAQRLLFPPEWEERQVWRQHYYDLTGKMLWNPDID